MANKFWVPGGSGNWNATDTNNWSLTTGPGTPGAAIPGTADTAIFDANSGSGTVTVASSIGGTNTLVSITCGAFGGTLDFSVNNPTLTMSQFVASGSGARKILLGTSTFNLTGTNLNNWDLTTATNLDPTSDFSSATLALVNPGTNVNQTFQGGTSHTYGTLTIQGNTQGKTTSIAFTTAITFAALNINAPAYIILPTLASAMSITNPISWNGSSSGQIFIGNGFRGIVTVTTAAGSTISWAALQSLTFAGTPPTVTNSFNLNNNSNVTISPPSVGGGSVFGS